MFRCATRSRRLILSVLLLGLTQCQNTSVTVAGDPVSDADFVAATMAVHTIEQASVALTSALIAQRQQACHGLNAEAQAVVVACVEATGRLKRHATEIAPLVLTALRGARDVLLQVAKAPKTVSNAQLAQALAALDETWKTAQHLVVVPPTTY